MPAGAGLAGLSAVSGLVGGGCGARSASVGAGELPAAELALQGPEGRERRAAGQGDRGGQQAAGGMAGGPAQAHGGGPRASPVTMYSEPASGRISRAAPMASRVAIGL